MPTGVMAQEAGAKKEQVPADLLDQLNNRQDQEQAKPKDDEPKQIVDPLLNKHKKEPVIKRREDIPEAALEDTFAFEQSCVNDAHRAAHYDCECLASRYLERRIEEGPDVPANLIFMDVQAECPNLPAAAGFAYTECINQPHAFFPQGQDPEEYCTCVGNGYAKLFARSGRLPDSRNMVRMKTTAALSCTQQPPGVPVLVPPIR